MMLPFKAWPAQVGQLKVVSFLHKRQDLNLEQFSQHWRSIHRVHAQTLLDAGYLYAYVQTHRGAEPSLCQSHFDGSPEIWVEHIDTLSQLSASHAYREGAALDEANFIQLPVLSSVMQVTHVTRTATPEVTAAPYKLMLAISAMHSMPFSQFSAHWQQADPACLFSHHRPLAQVRHLAVEAGLDQAAFWALESTWWPSLADLEQAWGDQRLPAWLNATHLRTLVGQEHWVQGFADK